MRSSALLPVESIGRGVMRLRGGGLRAILECPTLAFGIKGEAEQNAVVDGWSALLNSLAHPLQVVIRSRRFDASTAAIGSQSEHARLRAAHDRLLDDLAGRREILDRRLFVVVPWDPSPRGRAKGADVLEQRIQRLESGLRRLDLEPRRLGVPEMAELLRASLDPAAVRQPIDDTDELGDVATLIAPPALVEHPRHLDLGGRFARTLAIARYPSRLRPGWVGDLATFDADLDVALSIRPSAGPAVMSFLERRVAELMSTVRVTENSGGRADPYRRVALEDSLALQDGIARGNERLFDASLLLTVWAEDEVELDAASERLEALLGGRLIHTRPLLFQMRHAMISTLPLGAEPVSVRKVLSTTALAATFPFTGTDLRARKGQLYGINSTTRSPVFLDRFALENHNSAVFATSGAGKSFLVKVELARAAMSGVRVMVIDPEGEYAHLVEAIGGTTVAIGPGAGGIDPFAIDNLEPGALARRIATITTLIEVVTGGLSAVQRAAVQDAISFVYARGGFADGIDPDALTAPRLAEVQARLQSTRSLESVAVRLRRYTSGSGRWLFESGGKAPDASACYVLAGLPEEERAAAMFLVLDRIWSSLRRSTTPTLVVVDEAWWLMGHPDTARFLFRLVKTARKRSAGLTLITQDVGDVLNSPDGEPLIANSALQILMRQAPQAIPRLADLFRLTRAEQSFLLNAQRGEGLLIAQGKRVPLRVVATDEEARLIAGKEPSE
jgi:hypothetical protein